MVHISKVYTKAGDGGQTMLADGKRVPKSDQRIRAYGDVDELNAVLGAMRLECAREPRRQGHEIFLDGLDTELARIQQELFNLGAELATPGAAAGEAKLVVADGHVERLERELDAHNSALPALRSFILPGGGPVGTAAHLCRTVCRRAEREVVTLAASEPVRDQAVRYLNRLSDYLFVVGRAAARALGYPEVLWDPSSV